MRSKILNKIQRNSLFLKIASIVIISVTLVTLSVSVISIKISRDAFIDTFSKSNDKVLTQITWNFSKLNEQVINFLNRVNESVEIENYFSKNDLSPAMEFAAINSIQTKLSELIPSNEFNDITVLIAGLNGKSHVNNSDLVNLDTEKLLKSDITVNAVNTPNNVLYQYADNFFTTNTKYDRCVVVTKALRSTSKHEVYGVAYIVLNRQMLQNYYEYLASNATTVLLLDQTGTVVSSNSINKIGKRERELFLFSGELIRQNLNYKDTVLDGTNYTVLARHMPGYNYNITSIINKDVMLMEMYNTKNIFIVSTVIAVLIIILTFFIIRQTTKPISLLAVKMSQVIDGKFDNYIPVRGNYEVRQLATAFNFMLKGLNQYMEQVMKQQNERRIAEINALQMQINPHFIYNTLSSIKVLIWQGNTEKSIQTMDSFIELLRNIISNTNEMITVSQEMINLKNYSLINQVRYGNHITIDFFVLPGCEDYLLPKLIIQPFVENAFFHAFLDRAGGSIRVFVKQQEELLVCEIMDNGIGMNGVQVKSAFKPNQKEQHFTGIGIDNVNTRIKLLFGEQYGVTISSEPNFGTTVRVTIPVCKDRE